MNDFAFICSDSSNFCDLAQLAVVLIPIALIALPIVIIVIQKRNPNSKIGKLIKGSATIIAILILLMVLWGLYTFFLS